MPEGEVADELAQVVLEQPLATNRVPTIWLEPKRETCKVETRPLTKEEMMEMEKEAEQGTEGVGAAE